MSLCSDLKLGGDTQGHAGALAFGHNFSKVASGGDRDLELVINFHVALIFEGDGVAEEQIHVVVKGAQFVLRSVSEEYWLSH